MFTLSNVLSFLRAPLAFLFIINRVDVRAVVVIAAMLTDGIDGYLARRYKFTTRFGAILDPLMDKFFVLVILTILFSEARIQSFELIALLSRDVSLFIFALYLGIVRKWKGYNYRSMLWGKVTTALQFPVLFLLAINIYVPPFFFLLFYAFGLCMLFELFFTLKTNLKNI
jgi:CDP-diacylglycerol--glycerol-3-phosphate 3-phosphatidyltransferase